MKSTGVDRMRNRGDMTAACYRYLQKCIATLLNARPTCEDRQRRANPVAAALADVTLPCTGLAMLAMHHDITVVRQ